MKSNKISIEQLDREIEKIEELKNMLYDLKAAIKSKEIGVIEVKKLLKITEQLKTLPLSVIEKVKVKFGIIVLNCLIKILTWMKKEY